MKQQRHTAIRDVLNQAIVTSQDELRRKLARRGFHVSREYSVDPLERHSVGDVMAKDVVAIPATALRKGPSGDHVFVIGPAKDGKMRATARIVRSCCR